MALGITSLSTQMREGWGNDLTGLAVRAGQVRAGVAPAAAKGAPLAAVTIDASTKALADAVAEVQRREVPADPTKADRLAGLEDRRMVVEIMEGNIDSQRRNDNNTREIVKRFDETGEVWEIRGGELKLAPENRKYLKSGSDQEYMDHLRARIPRMDESLQTMIDAFKGWRDEFEKSRRDIIEGR